jgi:quinol monooxygenase YgiN
MDAFAIFVEVKLKPNCLEAYLPLIKYDAEHSLKDEPGCKLFHILLPKENSDTIVNLYGVYKSEMAFKTYQQTQHFSRYFRETDNLVEKRTIKRLNILAL